MSLINREIVRNFRMDLDAALKELGEKYGMDVTTGNIRFSEMVIRCKVEGTVKNTKAKVGEPVAADESLPTIFGVGTKFRHKTSIFTVERVNRNKPKNMYSIVNQNGTRYVCGRDLIIGGLIKAVK